MEPDAERPTVVKYSPELGAPVGQTKRWPVWVWAVVLVIFIAFMAWLYAWA
jgi:hypothetical protein